ncbi:hypothetical protein HUG15_19855 [Salicibibacter cibarius]|uniref:DUF3139 domain-containing protein n=1 Tax=Salicibibacter cibarius TaxID=2743000 RepID=A0A7T7CD51_9BACI|nr:hypothetical protein [Salicibibacter cibarius]QQK77615.1 hypothetical protein HUG15_19855 [Salicibibacter cibarius]
MSFGKKLIPFYVAIALIALILYLIYKPSPEGTYEHYDEAKAAFMADSDLIGQQIVGEFAEDNNLFIVFKDDPASQEPHYAFACFSKKQNDEVVWHGSSNYFYGGGESTAIKSPCFDEEE